VFFALIYLLLRRLVGLIPVRPMTAQRHDTPDHRRALDPRPRDQP
jgi:hypothetical protein